MELINKAKGFIDAVLGEDWYADDNLINNVCKDYDISNINFIEEKINGSYRRRMQK